MSGSDKLIQSISLESGLLGNRKQLETTFIPSRALAFETWLTLYGMPWHAK